MEAIERQIALKTRLPFVQDSFAHLRETAAVLDPRTLNYELAANYSEEQTYSWCEALDITSGRPWYVPAKMAGYIWEDVPHPLPFATTARLATGRARTSHRARTAFPLGRRRS